MTSTMFIRALRSGLLIIVVIRSRFPPQSIAPDGRADADLTTKTLINLPTILTRPKRGNWEDYLENVRSSDKEGPLPGDRERPEGAFRCERCGRCCTSGLLVELLNPDIDLLLRAMPLEELVDKLVNISGDPARPRFVLRQSRGRCVFYDMALKCAVYETRPLACRAFPRRDDPNCPGSNLEPTSDMLSASRRGHHESIYMSLWEGNYYPESVLSAWTRKNRAASPNAAAVAGTRPGRPSRRGRRREPPAAAA